MTSGKYRKRLGSSPLTWRIQFQSLLSCFIYRIISTYVENTSLRCKQTWQRWDHLHLRGEYLSDIVWLVSCLGSSPLTWRIHFFTSINVSRIRIISTYVEITYNFTKFFCCIQDHLHIRGDHQPYHLALLSPSGSSPHTWRSLNLEFILGWF